MTSSDSARAPDDLAFLRQVLREMTHEIAAPLTPLFGHLDLLELRAQDPLTPMQTRCIHAMRRSLRRLSAINDRMLELARLERGHIPCEPAPLSSRAVVLEVTRRFSKQGMPRGVEILSEVAPGQDAQAGPGAEVVALEEASRDGTEERFGLAGAVAALTTRPVLGVPLTGGILDGVDALLSTVQMPPGIPVATFAVGPAGARNAAHFAAQIVAMKRPEVGAAIAEGRARGAARVEEGEAAIAGELEGKA